MPRGDRTGPVGMGPMTGRAAGYCAGFGLPGFANPIPRRGFGSGWGRGWRWRHWYHATGFPGWVHFRYAPSWGVPPAAAYGPHAARPSPEQEAEFLKAEAEWLKEQLEAISKRISELEKEE